jgi:hypothetical protein
LKILFPQNNKFLQGIIESFEIVFFVINFFKSCDFSINTNKTFLFIPKFDIKTWDVTVHMDATLQPARRIIARLLQEDAGFFPRAPLLESSWSR